MTFTVLVENKMHISGRIVSNVFKMKLEQIRGWFVSSFGQIH